MAVSDEAMNDEHPAGRAFNRARTVVHGLPVDPTQGQLWDWYVAVRGAVATLCEEVPSGSATQLALDLCISVVRGPEMSGFLAADVASHATRTMVGQCAAEAEACRRRLEPALALLSEGMQRDVEGALRAVLRTLESLSDERVSSLLDVEVETVSKWRDLRSGWVHPARVIVVARLLRVLLVRRHPGSTPRLDWFWESSEQLDGRRPIDLLDQGPWGHCTALMQVANGLLDSTPSARSAEAA